MSEQPNMCFSLTADQLSAWRKQFFNEPRNLLAQNVCTTHDPLRMCLPILAPVVAGPPIKHGVDSERKTTSGGPAWITTGLDLLRLEFAKSFTSLPVDFEFSAGYLVYWHKLERCNYLLHAVAEHLMRGEPVDGRQFRYLMKHVLPDGGNWQMFVNLVKKYGVVPKQCYQTTGRTRQLNVILRSKLREFVSVLHNRFIFDGDGSGLPTLIGEMMPQLYKVINIVLGEPPQEFKWTYYDSKKRYQCLEPLTGSTFFKEMVNKNFDLDEMVCLAHDPRLSSSYLHNYEVALSSNMVGGRLQRYNNQSMDVLVPIIVRSLVGGKAVWLVYDLLAHASKNASADFPLLFGLEMCTDLNKAERMLYKETGHNQVLLLTEVLLDDEDKPVEFRTNAPSPSTTLFLSSSAANLREINDSVEEKAKIPRLKPSFCIKTDWVREYAFEIVVHSCFVPPDVLGATTRKECKELPPWDIMGAFLK
ncbi:bleomycin hydrolase [Drosophila miranda]|uniref:bleomycin hydrolase n=1 Tax=Drosophila miranda TaxID=7229 RepID=UPI0007E6EDC6|nr:bleomycin hydrolase [Drosophila miranda]